MDYGRYNNIFFCQLGYPVTAIGNNMGFLRSSYWATGGYQNLPFSLTEDYLLFAEILKKGYGWQWVHESATCNQTEPVDSFLDLLQQKKRGFEGGKQGPLAPALLFFYYALFYPILVIFFVFLSVRWEWAVGIFLLKSTLEFCFLWLSAIKIGVSCLLRYYGFYIIYSAALLFLLPIFLYCPSKSDGKVVIIKEKILCLISLLLFRRNFPITKS